jgi:hypothetical protein
MSTFRFFFFDATGTAKESTTGDQTNECDAIAAAEHRLTELGALDAVEIWRGSSLIQSLKRDGEQFMSQPLGECLALHPLFNAAA